jgi:riboflavin kinase/FMN adenylyltransferase
LTPRPDRVTSPQRQPEDNSVTSELSPLAASALTAWTGEGAAPAPLRGAVVAIGNFDGVHLGHKALLVEAARLAAAQGRGTKSGGAERLAVGLITFEPHPRSVFRPDQPVFRLTTPLMRRILAAENGCEAIAELPFDKPFAARSAASFIDELLLGQIDVAGVVIGGDFAFGRSREGDADMLRDRLRAAGRFVSVAAPVLDGEGGVVSSSRIRDALGQGDVARANALLGHRWRIAAEVVHGDKRGRLLGYPTANMALPPDNRLRHGIYAVRLRIDGAWRGGVASFGRRPTFDDGAPRLESHVFDYAGDLYGRTVEVEFAGWIRGELKFDSVDALIARMDADSLVARGMLG